MKTRRLHKLLGICLLLPFIGWAITGIVFFVKPGYAGAYEMLQPRLYPLESRLDVLPRPEWLELRRVRTVLGEHLLVRTDEGWLQLDTETLQQRPAPADDDVARLLHDAFGANPQRYGSIVEISGNTVATDTGVVIDVDWNRLNFSQQGRDTKRIDALYRIHYLQWTGIPVVDRVLGIAGLLLLITLTALGAKLAFARRRY